MPKPLKGHKRADVIANTVRVTRIARRVSKEPDMAEDGQSQAAVELVHGDVAPDRKIMEADRIKSARKAAETQTRWMGAGRVSLTEAA